jgi:DNA-binding XRE family transcriptional regulator
VETVEVFGVKHARTTVTYRFNLTEKAAPLLLPTSYTSARRSVRIPIEPKTIGDHIRRKRLSMKLLQTDLAERLGVKKTTIYTWEGNYATPEAKYVPAIINFLGYNPLPAARNWAERLVRHRITLGLTQRTSAQRIGVDQSTLARWERGEREPSGALAVRATCFLCTAVVEVSQVQQTG